MIGLDLITLIELQLAGVRIRVGLAIGFGLGPGLGEAGYTCRLIRCLKGQSIGRSVCRGQDVARGGPANRFVLLHRANVTWLTI